MRGALPILLLCAMLLLAQRPPHYNEPPFTGGIRSLVTNVTYAPLYTTNGSFFLLGFGRVVGYHTLRWTGARSNFYSVEMKPQPAWGWTHVASYWDSDAIVFVYPMSTITNGNPFRVWQTVNTNQP